MQFSPQARIEVLGCTSGLGDLHKAPLMGEHGEPLMWYTVSNGMRFSGFSQVAIISYMAALQYRGEVGSIDWCFCGVLWSWLSFLIHMSAGLFGFIKPSSWTGCTNAWNLNDPHFYLIVHFERETLVSLELITYLVRNHTSLFVFLLSHTETH